VIVLTAGAAFRGATRTLGGVFRSRTKSEQAAARSTEETSRRRDPQAPKGRPTPKRSEAQSQRRTVVKAPGDRKEATKRAREARRIDATRQREALANGDERFLPARDKGPVRRFARDYVDSRWSVAEFFLPLAIVILLLSIVGSVQLKSLALLLWIVVIVLILLDSLFKGVALRTALSRRFPNESRRGVVLYALMRTLQMRKMRLPKPQVARGERP
jgi:DUF3043 family protein